MNPHAIPFIPVSKRTIYNLCISGWFRHNKISTRLECYAMSAINHVWKVFGPWRESKDITLQELYNAYRIDPDLFTEYKLDKFFAHPNISLYLQKENSDLAWYVEEIKDDIRKAEDSGNKDFVEFLTARLQELL